MNLPEDFRPVSGCMPEWIDLKEICADATRFIGLYALSNLPAVVINNGKAIITTSDRNGEFKTNFHRAISESGDAGAALLDGLATLVYDCREHRQWVAPRPSAVQFLYSQFDEN